MIHVKRGRADHGRFWYALNGSVSSKAITACW